VRTNGRKTPRASAMTILRLSALLFPRRTRLSTTVVPRSRQEGGASCRLLALIVSRQVARADACRAVPPTSLRPTSAASTIATTVPSCPLAFPSPVPPFNSPGPSAILPPNRATNRRLRIGVSCARFDLLRRPWTRSRVCAVDRRRLYSRRITSGHPLRIARV